MSASFTIFCRAAHGRGTTWIDSVQAKDLDDAKEAGREACARDWDCDRQDVHVLGVATGDIKILDWQDTEDD